MVNVCPSSQHACSCSAGDCGLIGESQRSAGVAMASPACLRVPIITFSFVFNNINFSELETFVNSGDSDVSGFELNFFNEFTIFSEPFNGLFISANLTLTDGESTLETDNGNVTFPFRKLSETSKNLSIGYVLHLLLLQPLIFLLVGM